MEIKDAGGNIDGVQVVNADIVRFPVSVTRVVATF